MDTHQPRSTVHPYAHQCSSAPAPHAPHASRTVQTSTGTILQRKCSEHLYVRCTDAAHYTSHHIEAASIIEGSGDVVSTATIKAKKIIEDEKTGIAQSRTSATTKKHLLVTPNRRVQTISPHQTSISISLSISTSDLHSLSPHQTSKY